MEQAALATTETAKKKNEKMPDWTKYILIKG